MKSSIQLVTMRFLNMSYISLAGICFSILAFSSMTNAVSRVGGGKIQGSKSEFEMTIPYPFIQFDSYASNALRVSGPPAFTPAGGAFRQYIDIVEFSDEFSNLNISSRDELLQYFISRNWENVSTDCSLHFIRDSGNVVAQITIWGTGKGVALKGISTADIATAMMTTTKSLTRPTGECSWK